MQDPLEPIPQPTYIIPEALIIKASFSTTFPNSILRRREKHSLARSHYPQSVEKCFLSPQAGGKHHLSAQEIRRQRPGIFSGLAFLHSHVHLSKTS